MNFEELDDKTRKYMLEEFHKEQSNNPYRSGRMTSEGLKNVIRHIEDAIKSGNEVTLIKSLSNPSYWKSEETRHKGNTTHQARIDPNEAAKTFGLTEFNTWYVRGLAKRLMDEGQEECEIYRAQYAEEPRCTCSKLERHRFKVKDVYDGHRAKYHPTANYAAFSIPSGPNCHHTIRGIKK
ncbi:MAG: hypothetical protein WAO91_08795 [Candidatus Nitrosotenuis sp.]